MINEGWAFICVIAVWGWILSLVAFILKVFPARNTFEKRSAIIWGVSFIAFYVIWVTAMIRS